MLVKISVENFKSFQDATELTMISSNKIRTNASHRLKIKSIWCKCIWQNESGRIFQVF